MTLNYPGPYALRFFIDSNNYTHKIEFSVRCVNPPSPGDLFTAIDLVTKGGGSRTADVVADDFATVLSPFYRSADQEILYCELWEYDEGTFDATFISSYDLSTPGGSALAAVPAGQLVVTWRTLTGGIAKLVMMRTTQPAGFKIAVQDFGVELQAINTFFTATTAVAIGRDGQFYHTCLGAFPGENERLFKKIYRQ